MRLSWWTRVRTWGLRHGGRETGVIDRIFEEDLKLPGKRRLAAKHIFERLRDEYDFLGGYTIVKEYVREHRCRTREMFVPLAHPPGMPSATSTGPWWSSAEWSRRPNCPKSSSATFPDGLSSSRPAVLLGLLQFRFWMKPRGDW